MQLSTHHTIVVLAAMLVAAGIAFFSAPTGTQDDRWQRAEYGTKTQEMMSPIS